MTTLYHTVMTTLYHTVMTTLSPLSFPLETTGLLHICAEFVFIELIFCLIIAKFN
jgi:hypothetical protein